VVDVPQICQGCVQLLLVLEVLFQIHAATDFGVRKHSQISSTTSKINLRCSNVCFTDFPTTKTNTNHSGVT
jgi:hypothetical protein